MSRSLTILTMALATLLLPACSDRNPTGIKPQSGGSQIVERATKSANQTLPDISGAWNWSNVEVLRMPRWLVEAFAPILGITPEGNNTHARCESAGTMTLVQNGAQFQGMATRTFNACETMGGQSFQQPGAAFAIAEGRISGKSMRFSFHTATVSPCPHQAVIVEVQGGVAVALRGTGSCRLPGHPQSESPMVMDPPPGGTSTTISWNAWRP